jgi:membrane protease YdiL (CAAX protease family)
VSAEGSSPAAPHTQKEAILLLGLSAALEALTALVPDGTGGSFLLGLKPTLHVLAWTAPAYFAVERRGGDPLVAHGVLVRPRSLASSLGLALLVLPLYVLGFFVWRGRPASWPPLGPALERIARDVPFAALPEEYFFRGAFQPSIWPTRPYLAIVVTSSVFAAAHVVFDPDHSLARLLVFFPSLLFGWLRLRTGSIVPGIFFHALSNGVEEFVWSVR